MAASSSENESSSMEKVRKYIEEHGLYGIKEKLEEWKDQEITIGVTGESGSGKSSFINAIRGLEDDGRTAGVAKTGVVETTKVPKAYPLPNNHKIQFCDLPGIGTPSNPTEKTYYKKVAFDKFDAFLILSDKRFTEINRQLACTVKSANKPFFFIRTQIDKSLQDQKRKADYSENKTLALIRRDCLNNLNEFITSDEDVFLISNHHPLRWDFSKLTKAIIEDLPTRQKECFLFSFDSLSKDMVKQKVEFLRGRIWKVSSASGFGAVVPIPGVALAVDLALIANELNFYKTQLSLPEESSDEFKRMTPEWQAKIGKYLISSVANIASMLAAYAARVSVEEYARFIPILGFAIASSLSFATTYSFLSRCLNEIEEIALEFLDAMTESREGLSDDEEDG